MRTTPPRRPGWPTLWAGGITVLVAAGAVFSRPALRDAATLEPVPGARLVRPAAYLFAAPVHGVIDAISLLTLGQHLSWIAGAAVIFALWRIVRRGRPRTILGRVGVEMAAVTAFLAVILGIYLVGLFVPRPMARLALTDPDLVAVDFHSHTEHSHDGRRSFTVERNRAWHAGSGYHAVFVSDHRNWAAMPVARAGNPRRAGEGTVLLPAMETRFRGDHVVALGEADRYRDAFDEHGNLDPAALDRKSRAGAVPTLVLTLPTGLSDLRASTPDAPVGLVGIELSDASPKGLEQSRRDRLRLLRLADSLDLAVVAGSNTHGLGSTAAGWSVLRIPGWRDLTPDALARAIERQVLRERRDAGRVVERWIPYPSDGLAGRALTLPLVGWHLFATLSPGERIAWLAWTWGIALAVGANSRRSRREPAGDVRERSPELTG